jgi:hypothetical protein
MPFTTPRLIAVTSAASLLLACAPKVVGPQRLIFITPPVDREGAQKTERDIGDLHLSAPVNVPSWKRAAVSPGPFAVSLRFVEAAERRKLVRETLGGDFDPFATNPRQQPFVTILMGVRNDAPEPLVFNPQNILLVTDRPSFLPPLDATRAYESMVSAGLPADRYMSHMHRLIYDTAITLRTGESVSRLLAYRTPAPEVEKARLQFSFFQVGLASYSFTVPMAQVPVSEIERAVATPGGAAGTDGPSGGGAEGGR